MSKLVNVHRLLYFPIHLLKYLRMKLLFNNFGFHSTAGPFLRIQGGKNIVIGNRVRINKQCWLAALPLTGYEMARLSICDGAVLGDFNHIWATKSIRIEKFVLTANHVYISDNLHGYDNVEVPIINQPIVQLKEVVIGEGSWIGENVCIIGASVGKHSVVGANAVVIKDIPDYCVAVGIPARVIKKYNIEREVWEKVN